MPVSNTSHSRISIRALPRWSANSLRKTVPHPVQGEPLRRAMGSLEISAVDRVQAGLGSLEPLEPCAGAHDQGREIGADVAAGDDVVAAGALGAHAPHALDARDERLHVAVAARFDVEGMVAAQHTLGQFRYRAD